MANNKTQPAKVSVAAFIEALTDQTKRSEAKQLIKLMQSATGEKPTMWGPSIVSFGSYHYTYDSGRSGDMPLIGFSPRKAATVLYGLIGFSDSGALLARLGQHTTGKGCLYVKKQCFPPQAAALRESSVISEFDTDPRRGFRPLRRAGRSR